MVSTPEPAGGEEGAELIESSLLEGEVFPQSPSHVSDKEKQGGVGWLQPGSEMWWVPCSLQTIPAKSPELCQALERERDLGIEAGATLHPNPHRALGVKAELHFPIWVCTEKLQFSKASDCCFSNKSNRWIGNSIYCLFPQHINM